MNGIKLVYRGNPTVSYIPVSDKDVADQLFRDLLDARMTGKTLHVISSNDSSCFIDPSDIVECSVVSNGGLSYHE